MSTLHSYLTFNGNCREAMTFYQKCLGGQLVFETMGDSPMGAKIPYVFKPLVVQATLSVSGWTLVGSDLANENGLQKGNAVAMMLRCDSKEEAVDVYRKLVQNGQPTHPLEGDWFGDLVDQFGNHWLIQFDIENY